MNRKIFVGLMAIASVLICMTGCSLPESKESSAERELLCQFRSGSRYVTDGGQYWEEKDPEWDSFCMMLDDQNNPPEEIRFEFTEEIEREVFAINREYQIVWKQTFSSGKHSVLVPETAMGFIFAVRSTEAFHLTGTGMHPKMETPYTGRRLSVLGDSVSAFSGYIPWEDYAYYSSMNFGAASMWWAVLAEKTGMELCKINAVSSSGVIVPEEENAGRLLSGNSERCIDLSSRDGENPDEILILLGGNDYLRQIPIESIRQEYLKMLSRIKKAYPEAQIHICTYFQSPAFPLALLKEFNELLRSIAQEAEVSLIDFENCGILEKEPEKYLIDGALHPNERGQILLGVCAAQQMLESSGR
ncbi:MAG: SGNH/GDSL hydrolase family protein [Clostridium sp.]|nr:SGNH/GDSL hydrolase family protein [Clostridium sp.]